LDFLFKGYATGIISKEHHDPSSLLKDSRGTRDIFSLQRRIVSGLARGLRLHARVSGLVFWLSRLTARLHATSHVHVFLVGGAVFLLVGGVLNVRYEERAIRLFTFSARASHEEVYAKKSFVVTGSELPVTTSSHLFLSAVSPILHETEGEEDNVDLQLYDESVGQLIETGQYTALVASTMPVPSLAPVYERTGIVTYTVEEGDTPSEIAQGHNISLSTLLWANELSVNGYIRPGDELLILPVNGLVHAVRSGETVGALASRYGSTVEKILTYNDIESDAFIVVGQSIIIPDGVLPRVAPARTYASSYSSLQQLAGYFSRPTAGRISQGLHRFNAVDIAGGCWQPVYTAASGSVRIASGNGRWNGGLGNFVSIEHPNGTSTLYAHLVQVLAYGGQNVTQGQTIGYTGSTGRSSGCHLHWEVRGVQNPLAAY